MKIRQEGDRQIRQSRWNARIAPMRAAIDALEPRRLLSQTIDLPLVNPGFETLYKPGSTTVTATIPDLSATEGFGADFPVRALSSTTLAPVTYSDGTTGNAVTIPGWSVVPIQHHPAGQPAAGIVRDSVAYPGKTDNFASIFYTPNGNLDSTEIRQTLVGTTLLPNSRYVLSGDVAEGGEMRLEVGSTFLSAILPKTTEPSPAGFTHNSKVFVTKATVPAGDITVVLGNGTDVTGDFDNIRLQLITSGATPTPSPTPVPQPFGMSGGHNRSIKLTQADGTIVTLSMTNGSGFATQEPNQIDLQLNNTTSKPASVSFTTAVGSEQFTLGNVTVTGSLGQFSAPAATLAGDMLISGNIGSMTLDSISGEISADSISRLKAGTVSGEIYSAGSIGSLNLGAVSATIDSAGSIGSISAASLTAASILSGVNLGAGGATPVSPASAVSYAGGTIGSLNVKGSVTIDTIVVAGANPVDGTFANGNDAAAGEADIGAISIGGFADPSTRFEASIFGKVKIHHALLSNLSSDSRFIIL